MPFQPLHFSSGPCVVTYNQIQLGFCEDGVRMTVQPFFDEVKSDDFGGRAGPPSDAQLLGAIASIECPLTKYVKAEVDKLSSFRISGNAGVLPPIGSFVRQGNLGGTLVLAGTNESTTFPFAFVRRNYELNIGTKFRTYMVGFECWMNQMNYEQLAQSQNRTLFTLA